MRYYQFVLNALNDIMAKAISYMLLLFLLLM